MPGSAYLAPGVQGPVKQDDPLDALAKFLGVPSSSLSGGGPDDASLQNGVDALRGGDSLSLPAGASTSRTAPALSMAAASGGGNRNQALSQAIATKYGVPGAGDGSVSQSDLEALDSFVRGHDTADKVAVAEAPARVTGEYGLQHQQIANQGTSDVARINERAGNERQDSQGRWEIEKEKLAAQAAVDAAKAKEEGKKPEMVGGFPVNEKPLDAVENRTNSALHEGSRLVGALEPLLDPTKDQALDKMGVLGKWMAYKSGFSTNPSDQQRMALAGQLKVLGASPYVAGSRHFQFMQQAQDHLTDPTATDARIYETLQQLKQIWPELEQGLLTAHRYPGAPLDFSPPAAKLGGSDPYADPNYQPK